MKKIGITFGDPNGISPEITIKALNFLDLPKEKIILFTNKCITDYYKEKYNLYLEKNYETVEIPYEKENINPGEDTKEAGEFSYRALKLACEYAQNNIIDALVTAPVSKNAMKKAGYNYNGQTEILEEYLAHSGQKAEMIFLCDKFSVLLVTRHIALKEVPENIKKEIIIEKIGRTEEFLRVQRGIRCPKFAICALNPHSGENGLFGDEEINEIIPAVKKLREKGINIEGPFPSDTLFSKLEDEETNYDCYVAMYHDQGLIPVKLVESENCVNMTAGLDIVRTSPAHGTAFDIAGKNIADVNSMISAIKAAIK